MCLAAESLVGMLELMQMQQHRRGDTVTVFCVGVGDGREQMAVAAACSAGDWEGPAIRFVGIEVDSAALEMHRQAAGKLERRIQPHLRPQFQQVSLAAALALGIVAAVIIVHSFSDVVAIALFAFSFYHRAGKLV